MKRIIAGFVVVMLLAVAVSAFAKGATVVQAASVSESVSGKIVSLAACGDNTVILMEDGSVWAWGDNSFGQLGEGAGNERKCVYEPVKISNLPVIREIAVGNGFILALDEEGKVWGVGNNACNAASTLRNADKISRPAMTADFKNIMHIRAGTNYAAVVKNDGTVSMWGDFKYQLGNPKGIIPVKGISDLENLYTLRYNTIAVDKNGIGWFCRGKYLEPQEITQVTGIVDIIEGVNVAYAVKDDGSVWKWKINTQAAEQIEGLIGIKSIAGVKDDDFIALDEEGFVWSWDYETGKVSKVPGLSGIISIAAGSSHFAALKGDNTIWAWGDNAKGQLGNGGQFFFPEPIRIESLDNVKQVAASKSVTAAVKKDGTLWVWGDNSNGQLGNGTREDSYIPVRVEGIKDVEKVAVGISHVLALKKDGTVWAWGSNFCGELGDGTYDAKLLPVQVQGIDSVKDIAAGNGFSIALGKGGKVWVWGSSGYGKDDDPAYKDKSKPVAIREFNSAKMVTAGYDHALSLRVDRSVWAWGSNSYGQYGYSPADSELKKKKAYRVPGIWDIVQISAGYSHNLALKRNGTVVSWGSNEYGQQGVMRNEKSSNYYVKSDIRNFSDIAEVAAGKTHSLAVRKDGTLWAWGDNSLGQLGTKDTNSGSFPVHVPGMTEVQSAAAGHDYSAAVKKDGTVWVWGSNIYGQLGIGKASKDSEVLPVRSLVN